MRSVNERGNLSQPVNNRRGQINLYVKWRGPGLTGGAGWGANCVPRLRPGPGWGDKSSPRPTPLRTLVNARMDRVWGCVFISSSLNCLNLHAVVVSSPILTSVTYSMHPYCYIADSCFLLSLSTHTCCHKPESFGNGTMGPPHPCGPNLVLGCAPWRCISRFARLF